MSDSFIQSFTHLKDRPKSDRALPMLQRIASLVKPIMRRHCWTLPVLAEFFPESPNLLGEQTASTLYVILAVVYRPLAGLSTLLCLHPHMSTDLTL